MIKEFNENGHPMVFSDSSVNTEQLKEKCANAIKSLSGVHGVAERKAEACFKIALSELENNWKQRAEAAEAKLAELAKQKPVGTVSIAMDWSTHRNVATVNMRHDLVVSEMKDGDELFTRPAPAADLADLVPDELTREAWRQLFINEDYQDTFRCGFSACRAAILRKIEEAK